MAQTRGLPRLLGRLRGHDDRPIAPPERPHALRELRRLRLRLVACDARPPGGEAGETGVEDDDYLAGRDLRDMRGQVVHSQSRRRLRTVDRVGEEENTFRRAMAGEVDDREVVGSSRASRYEGP